MNPHQIMIWGRVKYGKAIQRDEGEGGAILDEEAKKGLSDEVILEERPGYNETKHCGYGGGRFGQKEGRRRWHLER